jgi:3-oxoacyl-[acyl-carrier-protein] synthase II
MPDTHAHLVPDFDLRARLGRSGTKAMDRGTGLVLTALADLIEQVGGGDLTERDDTGLVLGTSCGSAESMMQFTRQSLTGHRPWFVDAALMPYAVMNAAAGQCAIRHGLRGPNATLAAGRGTALQGLRYARQLLCNDRAERVLVGAVEDHSRARAWLWRHSGPPAGTRLGEAAVMLLVERAGAARPALAEVLAVETRLALDGDPTQALTESIRSACKTASVDPEQVGVVSVSDAPGTLGDRERDTVADLVGERARTLPALGGRTGETGAASAALQLAAVLVAAAEHPGQVALVTSVDRDGAVSCALLRLTDG